MKLSSIVKEVLHHLAAGVVITGGAFRRGSFTQKSNWINAVLNRLDSQYPKKEVQQVLTRLYLVCDVERIIKNGKVTIRLTEKGRKKLLTYELHDMCIKKPNKWDGIWRIIIFDIPEKYKSARDALRKFHLQKLGFAQIQDSVFVLPYECRDEIDFIAEFYGIRKYIRIMETSSLDGGDELKKHFRI